MASPSSDVGEEQNSSQRQKAADYDANIALLQIGNLMVSSGQSSSTSSGPTGDLDAEQASRNEVCMAYDDSRPAAEGGEVAGVGVQNDKGLQAR